jgi:hypothetical protein
MIRIHNKGAHERLYYEYGFAARHPCSGLRIKTKTP